MELQGLFSTAEAAEYCDMTVGAFKHYVYHTDALPSNQIGGRLVFSKSVLDEFLATYEKQAGPRPLDETGDITPGQFVRDDWRSKVEGGTHRVLYRDQAVLSVVPSLDHYYSVEVRLDEWNTSFVQVWKSARLQVEVL